MKKILVLFLISYLCTGLLQSQDQAGNNVFIGLGLYFETPKLSDYYQDFEYPANKIILSVNLFEKIKIEPEFGLYLSQSKDNQRETATITGIGAFYQFNKYRTIFYTGTVFEMSNQKITYFNAWPDDDDIMIRRSYILGPALGAEYYFSEHFSLGGEIGLKYIIYRYKSAPDDDDPRKESRLISDTGIKLRFYF